MQRADAVHLIEDAKLFGLQLAIFELGAFNLRDNEWASFFGHQIVLDAGQLDALTDDFDGQPEAVKAEGDTRRANVVGFEDRWSEGFSGGLTEDPLGPADQRFEIDVGFDPALGDQSGAEVAADGRRIGFGVGEGFLIDEFAIEQKFAEDEVGDAGTDGHYFAVFDVDADLATVGLDHDRTGGLATGPADQRADQIGRPHIQGLLAVLRLGQFFGPWVFSAAQGGLDADHTVEQLRPLAKRAKRIPVDRDRRLVVDHSGIEKDLEGGRRERTHGRPIGPARNTWSGNAIAQCLTQSFGKKK